MEIEDEEKSNIYKDSNFVVVVNISMSSKRNNRLMAKKEKNRLKYRKNNKVKDAVVADEIKKQTLVKKILMTIITKRKEGRRRKMERPS